VIFFSESLDILLNKRIRIYRELIVKLSETKECTKRKNGIRIVKMYPYEEERHAMDRKMQLPESKEIYKLRKEIVEPVFGDIKGNKGVTVFLQGIKDGQTEMNLISIANNIYRFHLRKSKPVSIEVAF